MNIWKIEGTERGGTGLIYSRVLPAETSERRIRQMLQSLALTFANLNALDAAHFITLESRKAYPMVRRVASVRPTFRCGLAGVVFNAAIVPCLDG